MATKCPHATWDPLSNTQTQPRMDRHDIVCLHTMAGTFAGTNIMFHEKGFGGTESHFGIAGSGLARQWQDLDFTADANNEGNHRVISIETADKGEDFPRWVGSDVPPWTPAQLDKIVAIVGWCCDRYGIPRTLIPDTMPHRRGIGYHRQGIPGNFLPPYSGKTGPGELWTVLPGGFGKPCPGTNRIRQIETIIIPRLQKPAILNPSDLEDDDMVILRNKTNKHTCVFGSGKLTVLTGEANVATAREAGIPVWSLEDDDYDRLVKVYGPVQA